jgi:WD40 repeat protein
VRDVCWNPHDPYVFAAGFENGLIQTWDVRWLDDCLTRTQAHDGVEFFVNSIYKIPILIQIHTNMHKTPTYITYTLHK